MTEEYIQVKKKAFSLLARREHGVQELKSKLIQKNYVEEVIDLVVSDLITENYLSDERYVEMMFRYHFGRGQGPRKIINLIKQVNISNEYIQDAFRDFEGDWFELAKVERQKKFGDWHVDLKDKNKQTRFLIGRGFEYDHIEFAFNASEHE